MPSMGPLTWQVFNIPSLETPAHIPESSHTELFLKWPFRLVEYVSSDPKHGLFPFGFPGNTDQHFEKFPFG